ncbi:hypothetical protein LZG04_31270 [Saccharothrix sp. S26]|uniref:hypothetical protein n=1 Tax=Saccharothrix sp. S26 TaxID=2907215 RepID=UPI001F459000|nr:hypothetical protein [Saccharothrix sp. S26]MCE6999254.1 hypothetical protein [Saccharothrix sp. S26]
MGISRGVAFAGAGVALAGSLAVPDMGAPLPGVGGSGPSDRHDGGHPAPGCLDALTGWLTTRIGG